MQISAHKVILAAVRGIKKQFFDFFSTDRQNGLLLYSLGSSLGLGFPHQWQTQPFG